MNRSVPFFKSKGEFTRWVNGCFYGFTFFFIFVVIVVLLQSSCNQRSFRSVSLPSDFVLNFEIRRPPSYYSKYIEESNKVVLYFSFLANKERESRRAFKALGSIQIYEGEGCKAPSLASIDSFEMAMRTGEIGEHRGNRGGGEKSAFSCRTGCHRRRGLFFQAFHRSSVWGIHTRVGRAGTQRQRECIQFHLFKSLQSARLCGYHRSCKKFFHLPWLQKNCFQSLEVDMDSVFGAGGNSKRT